MAAFWRRPAPGRAGILRRADPLGADRRHQLGRPAPACAGSWTCSRPRSGRCRDVVGQPTRCRPSFAPSRRGRRHGGAEDRAGQGRHAGVRAAPGAGRALAAELVGLDAAREVAKLFPGENIDIPLGLTGAVQNARRTARQALDEGRPASRRLPAPLASPSARCTTFAVATAGPGHQAGQPLRRVAAPLQPFSGERRPPSAQSRLRQPGSAGRGDHADIRTRPAVHRLVEGVVLRAYPTRPPAARRGPSASGTPRGRRADRRPRQWSSPGAGVRHPGSRPQDLRGVG